MNRNQNNGRFLPTEMLGQKYGMLTVLSLAEERDSQGKYRWFCQCECGNTTHVRGTELRSGHTVSCGHYGREKNKKHGYKGTPTYQCWADIKQRCLNPRNSRYQDYGGRGITVCSEWKNDFSAFLQDMGERPSEGYSIDRIDNDGNYEPGNVRWATASEQARNRRNASLV